MNKSIKNEMKILNKARNVSPAKAVELFEKLKPEMTTTSIDMVASVLLNKYGV